jgi:hypothetical protein
MAQHDMEFDYTQPIIIGGPSGNYFLDCPIPSCKYAEFAIVSISTSANANILISGKDQLIQLDYTGATILNDSVSLAAIALTATAASPYNAPGVYYRVTNSQKRIFMRIDVSAGNACFVTLRFRIMPISVIPGPAPTAHHEQGHLVNAARSEMTRARLEQMGIPIRVGQEGGTDGGRQS